MDALVMEEQNPVLQFILGGAAVMDDLPELESIPETEGEGNGSGGAFADAKNQPDLLAYTSFNADVEVSESEVEEIPVSDSCRTASISTNNIVGNPKMSQEPPELTQWKNREVNRIVDPNKHPINACNKKSSNANRDQWSRLNGPIKSVSIPRTTDSSESIKSYSTTQVKITAHVPQKTYTVQDAQSPESTTPPASHVTPAQLRQRRRQLAKPVVSDGNLALLSKGKRDPNSIKFQPSELGFSPASEPMNSEMALVCSVAFTLLMYIVACFYAFFHPIHVPLPDYRSFQTPIDMSNVSIEIVTPRSHLSLEHPVHLEWRLTQFPVHALQKFGPDVFQYRIFLNDELIISEIGFWDMPNDSGDTIEESPTLLNQTLRHHVPVRRFKKRRDHEFHIVVTFPIPGNDGQVRTIEEKVIVTKPTTEGEQPQLELIAPQNGSSVAEGQPLVVNYKAVEVASMHVMMDGKYFIQKTHIEDGNLLLRGLGVGHHSIDFKAYSTSSDLVAQKTLHIEVLATHNG